jgi:hypothetical protein
LSLNPVLSGRYINKTIARREFASSITMFPQRNRHREHREVPNHGLINYTAIKAFVVGIPALTCHPSRRKCIHLRTGRWGGGGGVAQDLRKTQKLPLKDSDGIRSLSIIHVHCRPSI